MAEDKVVRCLGIESTAHTFGASVASEDVGIVSDVKKTYKPARGSGIHPREAAQHHSEVAPHVIARALEEGKIPLRMIDAVAVSIGPGLGPALRVGATVARAIAELLSKPLIPVHHGVGHIEIGALTGGSKDPLAVLVSGGHTAIAACAEGRWRIYGETEDIAIGNLLDNFARRANLPPPGGPAVEELAKKAKGFVDLPYTVKGNDVSYSGLLTAATKKLEDGVPLEDLCFSVQEVAYSMLAEAVERTLAHTEKREVLLIGGVASNRELQKKLAVVASGLDAAFQVVDRRFAGDCGAQIAWTGIQAYKAGVTVNVEESFVRPRWRLDDVDIPWRK